MSLISISFLVFLTLAVLGYYLLPKRARWAWLLAVSLLFYGMADLRYLVFLLFSAGTTYGAALLMTAGPLGGTSSPSKGRRKLVLALVLLLNLGLLFFLKFYHYSASILEILTGGALVLPYLNLIMPLGISFYTLQVAGYCIDVYRGKVQPQRNPLKYLLFVSFFPQIIQGPIPRYDFLAPQLLEGHSYDARQVKFGLQRMLWGYFKKMVIADRAGLLVATVFDGYAYPAYYDGAQVALAAVLFSIQLYADFSGCVDIVTGAAQTMGIRLPQNFDRPYFATSIQDFWRRWHISLSSWLRDYVYIPLGGSRRGRVRQYGNIMVVFLVSGLWHGVGVTYLVWGLLHGFYQVVGKLLQPVRSKFLAWTKVDQSTAGFRLLQSGLTFGFVTLAWIFFRAPSLGTALSMCKRILLDFQLSSLLGDSLYTLGLNEKNLYLLFFCIALLFLVELLQIRIPALQERMDRQPLPIRWLLAIALICAVLIFGVYGANVDPAAFIYEQF